MQMLRMSNAEQVEYWNGPEGQHWVDREAQFDAMLAPFIDRILDAAGIQPTDRVLDIGCGNGATSRAAAARAGSVVGVDISAPMIERARSQAAAAGITNLEFIQADAQEHSFRAEFDVIVSRFGVMFFADPVAAFTNLASALVPGGRLAFACWQDLLANEWVAVAGMTLIPIVGPPDMPPPDAPGPFAFADRGRVADILDSAGFSGVEFDDVQIPLLLGGGLDVDATVEFFGEGGMAKRFLANADDATRARALDAVRDALEPFATDAGVCLGSAAWLVRANR
jgi:SAM-dependent methyltransferase